jgi:tetratricopeptide (TPR) repeat protein
VANDISDNALFLNRGETFEDVGLTAWVADYRGAMGLAAGDWNRDGDDDLFITHWLAQENALYDSHLADRREPPPGGPSPTTAPAPPRLTFSDLASPLGLGQIALHMVGWGTEFADLDGDGWLDLVVADGSTLENDATPKGLKPQEPLVLWNRDGEHFHDLAPLSELLSTPHVSRGMAVSDYDHDGDLDLLFVHWGEGVQLLRNEMPRGHWLEVALRSRGSDGRITGRGEGSTVVAWVGEVPLRRSLTEGSYLSQSSATLHFGLGDAPAVDRLEVHWLGGETATYGRLEGDARWEITEGSETPKRLGEALQAAAQADPADSRERVVAFWQKQRAGMDAMKREGDLPKAIAFFRQALELNPEHEDSRYYLATCLAAEGHPDEALHHLDVLRRQNPMSHRGHLQWATLRAETATSRVDLEAAEAAAERALEINREETGSLLLLGEIELLLGEPDRADQRLAQATRTNPKAVGGYFLRGFLAWRRGDAAAAAELLEAAQTARGPDWKPEGAAAEGDVQTRMHSDDSPLDRFWRRWDGSPDPKTAFRPLADYLATQAPARSG